MTIRPVDHPWHPHYRREIADRMARYQRKGLSQAAACAQTVADIMVDRVLNGATASDPPDLVALAQNGVVEGYHEHSSLASLIEKRR